MRWTDDQLRCINERDKNILVSAAAGSGKTAVLVERILSLMDDQSIDIDRFLIVTFTNAAAGEMKERIQKKLFERLSLSPQKGAFYRKQLTLLPRANIKTLHSFCIDVIRNNFHQINIDPDFRIGDMTEVELLKKEVIEEVLEDFYKDEEKNFIDFVESFTGNRNDSKLVEIIETTYNFILSKPEPIKWLRDLISNYGDFEEIGNTIWGKYLMDEVFDLIGIGENVLKQAIDLCEVDNGPEEYGEALSSDLEFVLLLSKYDDLKDILLEIEGVKFKTFKRISKDRKLELDENLIEKVKILREYYKKNVIGEIKGYSNYFSDGAFEKSTEFSISSLKVIIDIIEKFHKKFIESKIENNILDFNDIEHFTIEMLSNDDIAKYYKGKFHYIFVDEYQDNNVIQETIVGKIKKKNNLFLVGDVKQSIYGFRLAEPELFIEKYESYNDDKNSLRIDLNKNFRSSDTIIKFVNDIFKNVMTKNTNPIDYDKDNMLYPGSKFEELDGESIKVELIKRPDEDELGDELSGLTWVELEARKAALNVKEIVGQKIYDAKAQCIREITYRDIVILSRVSSNVTEAFNNVFSEEDIPLYIEDSRGYFDEFEVRILLDFLSLIDNNTQDIKLLSVMRSMIGGFSIEEIVMIRKCDKDISFYLACLEYMKTNENIISEKIKRLFDILSEERKNSNIKSLGEFIWDVALESRFYHYVGTMTGGKTRQGNIRLLVDRAVAYEKKWIMGLSGFLKYIDKAQTSSNDYSPASLISQNDNVVRFMTIHKSKGLEFPVVIITGMGKNFNFQDSKSRIVFHKELGIGMKYVDYKNRFMSDTLIRKVISLKKKGEVVEEEMRIFYVALTRCINRLILIGSTRDPEKSVEGWKEKSSSYFYKKAKSYYDFIMPEIISHFGLELKEGIGHSHKYVWDKCILETSNIDFIKKSEIANSIDSKLAVDNLLFKVYSNEKFNIFDKLFNKTYEYEDSTKIPSKLTVTMLKSIKTGNFEDTALSFKDSFKKPKFFDKGESLSGAEIGTITHKLMNLIDFKSVSGEGDINRQLDLLISKKLVTQEEISNVDVRSILKFSESNICKRMVNSQELYKELPFVLKMDEINGDPLLLQGIIDCYFVEDGKAVLIDYKTDRVDISPEITASRYKGQLDNYSMAIEKIRGIKVVEKYIYLMSVDKFIRF